MGQQFGGGRMGGVALAAGGVVEQNFLNMPVGPVGVLYLSISMNLKSTGSAFTAVVDTAGSAAAEGTDDLDILLNALFSFIDIYSDPGTLQGHFTPAQWRTVLGLMNLKDFDGSFINGFSIPASGGTAEAITIAIPVPYSMKNYFADGDVYHQGSNRLRLGEVDWTAGSSLTPNVVMANGTAAVTGLSVAVFTQTGSGTENDVGNVFQAKRLLSLPTVYTFDAGDRLGLLATTPAATFAATAINIGPYNLWPPSQFQAQYQADQLVYGGFDITARCTPLIWLARTRRFQDFLAGLGDELRLDLVSGVSTGNVYDIKSIHPSPDLMQKLGQTVSAGGDVSSATIAPPSGQAVPQALNTQAPKRLIPGKVSAAGVKTFANPAQLAQSHAASVARAGQLASILKVVKGK